MLNWRARLLWVTVEAATMPLLDHPGVNALHGWLDSWRGIGDIEADMARQGYDLQLSRDANEAWRATFLLAGREHAPHAATASAWDQTAWRAVQMAAREALRRAETY